MQKNEKPTKQAWVDPDDAPPLTAEFFERAELSIGGKIVREATGTLTRRGRPKAERPKKQVTFRLDQELVEKLKALGPGWQSRVNQILKEAVGI